MKVSIGDLDLAAAQAAAELGQGTIAIELDVCDGGATYSGIRGRRSAASGPLSKAADAVGTVVRDASERLPALERVLCPPRRRGAPRHAQRVARSAGRARPRSGSVAGL